MWEAQSSEESKHLQKRQVLVLHVDIIKDPFWQRYPNLLLPLEEVKKARKRQLQTDCNKKNNEYLFILVFYHALVFVILDFNIIRNLYGNLKHKNERTLCITVLPRGKHT